jgi:phospholipase/carboxylesterase
MIGPHPGSLDSADPRILRLSRLPQSAANRADSTRSAACASKLTCDLAGAEVPVVTNSAGDATAPVAILLHGFGMRADDLMPFAASMGVPGIFLFPNGPFDVVEPNRKGHAWWPIDAALRATALASGEGRDLAGELPPGLPAARARLEGLVAAARARWPNRPVVLGGFSQGAILSLDLALRSDAPPEGLLLLSAGRVAGAEWSERWPRVRGMPILQAHGRQDRDLSFAAARALHGDLVAAGADATWFPFDGGHEIPLQVLRQVKRFISRVHTFEVEKSI